jgi:hypothetical protein
LVGGLQVEAFGCESLECGHADPPACAAPLKGNQFAALALAKVGNLALCHECIPAVWPDVPLFIHEQVSQVTDHQLAGVRIDRQSFTPALSATGKQGHRPHEPLQLA